MMTEAPCLLPCSGTDNDAALVVNSRTTVPGHTWPYRIPRNWGRVGGRSHLPVPAGHRWPRPWWFRRGSTSGGEALPI